MLCVCAGVSSTFEVRSWYKTSLALCTSFMVACGDCRHSSVNCICSQWEAYLIAVYHAEYKRLQMRKCRIRGRLAAQKLLRLYGIIVRYHPSLHHDILLRKHCTCCLAESWRYRGCWKYGRTSGSLRNISQIRSGFWSGSWSCTSQVSGPPAKSTHTALSLTNAKFSSGDRCTEKNSSYDKTQRHQNGDVGYCWVHGLSYTVFCRWCGSHLLWLPVQMDSC